MPVTITNGTITYEQNHFFNLQKNKVFYSSKSISGCHGKWYYEFTHESGGSNFHLVGFGYPSSIQGVYFYPMSFISNKPRVYITAPFYDGVEYNDYIVIPFSATSDHTVGVGIDYEKKIFYVYYNNSYYEQKIKTPKKCDEIKAVAWGANIDMSDNISINYGITPFKYNITGFTPWAENAPKLSCLCSYSVKIIPFIFILLINSQ